MKISRYEYERRLCISLLGGKCVHCENDDIEVFELDHIDGDGFSGRRRKDGAKNRRGSTEADFKKARLAGRLSEIYQILCANCHRKKTRVNGEANGKTRDITGIDTPPLPLFDWGKIPSLAEQRIGLL